LGAVLRQQPTGLAGRIGPRMRSSTRPRPRNGVADLLPRRPAGGSSRDNKLGSCRPPLRCGQRCGSAVPGLLIATRPRWSRAWNTAKGVTSCPRSARSPAATMAPTPAPSRPSRSTPRRASSPAIPPPPATKRPTSVWLSWASRSVPHGAGPRRRTAPTTRSSSTIRRSPPPSTPTFSRARTANMR
jgi:hypothetical protein